MQSQNKKILVVEDESALRELLKMILRQEGFRVLTASSGKTGLMLAEAEKPDLILLDLMLPDSSGLDVCRTLRERQQNAPIIILTARSSEAERVIGLSLGANDYVAKPFSNLEVIARVKSQLQGVDRLAVKQKLPELLTLGNAIIDMATRTLRVGTSEIMLRHKEFELLRIFATNLNRVLTRDDLVAQVWGEDYEGENRVVDVQVCRLKDKLSKFPSCPLAIQAIRFVGYRCILTGATSPKSKRTPLVHCLAATGPQGRHELAAALSKHLSAGNQLLYLGRDEDCEHLQADLAAAAGFSPGQVSTVTLPTTGSSTEAILESLRAQLGGSEGQGWSGTVVAADVAGLLGTGDPAAFDAFEAAIHGLESFATRYPVSVYCLYDLAALDAVTLMALLHQHAWVLQRQRSVHNSLYQLPGEEQADASAVRLETAGAAADPASSTGEGGGSGNQPQTVQPAARQPVAAREDV